MKNFIVFTCCLIFTQLVHATTIRLITIGPGDAFWSAFGHTAIAVDEEVYGFGYFSFDDVVQSFIANQMQYDLGVSEINYEALLAEQQDRNFSVIELNLTDIEINKIKDYLNWHSRPENKTYTYDYFLNNCSTKIRDLLDQVWSGHLLKNNTSSSEGTYFSQTFPAKKQGLMNFGLAIGYGWPAYKVRSHWELMALPVYFERQVLESIPEKLKPRQVIYSATSFSSVKNILLTHWTLLAYVVFSTLFLMISNTQKTTSVLYLKLHGMIGIILLGLWFFTPHQVAAWNFNVLLFNPLGLFLLRNKFFVRTVLASWLLWLVLAISIHAWYLIPLLVPSLLSLKVVNQLALFKQSKARI